MTDHITKSAEADGPSEVDTLHVELMAFRRKARMHNDQAAEHESIAKEARKSARAATDAAFKIEAKLKAAHHAAAGKCQAEKRSGDAWSRYVEPCDNKAKPDSKFCGVHKRG